MVDAALRFRRGNVPGGGTERGWFPRPTLEWGITTLGEARRGPLKVMAETAPESLMPLLLGT